MAAGGAGRLACAHPWPAGGARRHHHRHRSGTGPRPARPGAATQRRGERRDRGRRPGLPRVPRRARLLGPAPGANPGGLPRANGGPAGGHRRAGGAAHPGSPVSDRGRAGPGTPPGPALLGSRSEGSGHRGRLRRGVPLRPRAGACTAGLGARSGRLRRQHLKDAGARHAAGLADPAGPAAGRPGRGQARQRPGQPRATPAGARAPDRERRTRAAHPGSPQTAAEPT